MSEPKYKRNKEILRLKRSGTSYKDLSDQFGVSVPRIREICNETRRREKREVVDIPEIEQAIAELGVSDHLYAQIITRLNNNGYLRFNRWKTMTVADMQSIRAFGYQCIRVITKAQEIAKSK